MAKVSKNCFGILKKEPFPWQRLIVVKESVKKTRNFTILSVNPPKGEGKPAADPALPSPTVKRESPITIGPPSSRTCLSINRERYIK